MARACCPRAWSGSRASSRRATVVAVVGQVAGGEEFARGLVNFDAAEVRRIRGAKTREIEQRLGYKSFDEVIHRDNLVIL